MTDERMALIELAPKQADGDLVREMLAFAAERIMELEVAVRAGAAKGVRSPLREAQRNGYRERDLGHPGRPHRAGDPQAAQGQRLPELPGAPADGREGAGGGDPGGVCPRRLDPAVDDLVQAMLAGGMSKSQVSRLCVAIDERVNGFLSRPLEGAWPYLWLDAT